MAYFVLPLVLSLRVPLPHIFFPGEKKESYAVVVRISIIK
jgi:hypothetical protein